MPIDSNVARATGVLRGMVLRIQGIDLSGDPSKGDPANFLPALARARTLGLKLAVHLAELDRPEDTDALLRARQVQPHALPNWSRGFANHVMHCVGWWPPCTC